MPESIQDRIKRALATERLELDETASASANGKLMFCIRDKRRDRGREVAEKLVRVNSVNPKFAEIRFDNYSRGFGDVRDCCNINTFLEEIRCPIAHAINASNAELIREVLEIMDQHDKASRYHPTCSNVRNAIAALLPEATV